MADQTHELSGELALGSHDEGEDNLILEMTIHTMGNGEGHGG